MATEKTIYEVLHDIDASGPAADGTRVTRFRVKSDAERFAKSATYYGRPAAAVAAKVSVALARRWGC